jgi:hypothetical protein
MIIRFNGKAVFLALGMALVLGACSASAVPSGASNVKGAISAASQQAPPVSGVAAPTSAVVASVDACKLLTQAEVATAFNETMQTPVSALDHGDATCSYTHEVGGLDLTVNISHEPSSAAVINQLKGAYGTNAGVNGVGDAAFEVAGILEFVKGATLVTMGTGDGPAIITDARFQALAATAAGRI